MSGRLDGKVAVVTGGANGIGRACAERFAEEGADVVVADLLEEPAHQTVAAVEALGRKAIFVRIDASNAADNDAMVRAATDRFGRIDVLVTAAGISHGQYRSGDREREMERVSESVSRMGTPGAATLSLELDDWHRVLDVNLTGTLLAVRSVAPLMLENGRGSIITIASIYAKRPDGGYPYCVSKAGVWMLTKVASRDLAPGGVRVNAIGPGFIETNMTAVMHEFEAVKEMILPQIPMGRMGQPRDIANCALFLASDESAYMTGEILHPDGGYFTE